MYLEIRHLSKIIGQNKILSDINCQMNCGRIYGFMGINGSGKTMIMRCICGLVRPSSGEIVIDGKKLGSQIDFPEMLGALIECSYTVKKQQHKLRTAYPTILYQVEQ